MSGNATTWQFTSFAFDPDALAFIAAASITDTTQQNAVNQLVLDLKTANIWTSMAAIYPLVGNTDVAHSFNLVNTATFQITWHGTIMHNSNGITANGTNGYGDTGYSDAVNGTLNSFHLSIYSRTSGQSNTFEIGAGDASTRQDRLRLRATTDTVSPLCQCGIIDTVANTDGSGFFIMSRTSSAGYRVQIRGVNHDITRLVVNTGLSTIFISALNNNGTPSSFSSKNIAFVSLGTGLTQTDAANFDTAVQNFQTTLGRQV